MKHFKIIFAFSVSLSSLISIQVAGQEVAEEAKKKVKDIVMTTPEGAAFQKFGYNPVTPNTGTSSIDIPLYTLQQGDLSLPISLSYLTGGIRVDETATRQGLGWILNAGGMITRTIVGRPDETTNGYLNSRNLVPNFNDADIQDYGPISKRLFDLSYSVSEAAGLPIRFNERGLDLEPDIFTYNLNGKSGKFYFSKEGNIVTEDLSPLRIEKLSNNLHGFKITDEQGVVYIFDQDVKSINKNATKFINGTYLSYEVASGPSTGGSGNLSGNFIGGFGYYNVKFENNPGMINIPGDFPFGDEVNTGWYCSKIIHPNQADVISFEYIGDLYESKFKSGQSVEYPYMIDSQLITAGFGNVYGEMYGPMSMYESEVTSSYFDVLISKIKVNNGEVQFYYESDRKTRGGEYNVSEKRLSSIVCRDGEGNRLKKIELLNDAYFKSTEGYEATVKNRLKLTGIKISGDNFSNEVFNYRFKYNEENLPAINSFRKDYWGYHNGKGNNDLIPVLDMKTQRLQPGSTRVGNADRTADENAMKAFILEEVYFPTGGLTKYSYSAHRGIKDKKQPTIVGGLRTDRIFIYPDSNNRSDFMYKRYEYSFNGDFRGFYPLGVGKLIGNKVSENNFSFKQNSFWGKYMNTIVLHSEPTFSPELPGMPAVEYNSIKEYDYGNDGTMNGYKAYGYSDSGFATIFDPKRTSIPYSSKTVPEDFHDQTYIRDVHDSDNINIIDYGNNYRSVHFAPVKYVYSIENWPKLVSEEIYDKDNKLIKSTYKEYTKRASSEHVIGLSVASAVTQYDAGSVNLDYTPKGHKYYSDSFTCFLYEIPLGTSQLTKETTNTRKGDTYLTQQTTYEYERSNGFMRKISSVTSENKTAQKHMYYPADYALSTSNINTLMQKHILSPTILEFSTINNIPVDGNVFELNENGQPVSMYSLKQGISGVTHNATQLIPTLGFEPKSHWKYKNGRLVEKSLDLGPKTSYLWSYKNTLPVAEIKNMDFAAIESMLGEANVSAFGDYNVPSPESFIAPLKINSSLKDIQITTSEYKPLIGITRQVDIKGKASSFEYDGLQRLKYIKDQYGHIVKGYNYNLGNRTTISPVAVYYSDAKSQTFIRNNCDAAFKPYKTVTYEVKHNAYCSPISKANADAIAQNDINLNGQNYANANGICIPSNWYFSESQSRLFTKTDCPDGYIGTKGWYIVPEEQYFSSISLEDANNQALAEINSKGQNYVNMTVSCEKNVARILFSKSQYGYSAYITLVVTDDDTTLPVKWGELNNYTTNQSVTLEDIPPGTYKIIVSTTGGSVNRITFRGQTVYGASATFKNVELVAGAYPELLISGN